MSSQPGASLQTGSANQFQNEANIQPLLQTTTFSNLQSQLNTFNSMISKPVVCILSNYEVNDKCLDYVNYQLK